MWPVWIRRRRNESLRTLLVTIKKFAELTGLTEEAIRQYIKKGQWREKIHWRKAPERQNIYQH